jgi:hypothetical protein
MKKRLKNISKQIELEDGVGKAVEAFHSYF